MKLEHPQVIETDRLVFYYLDEKLIGHWRARKMEEEKCQDEIMCERPTFNGGLLGAVRGMAEQALLKESEYKKQNRQRFYSSLIATCAQYMAMHEHMLDEALEVQQYVLRRMKKAKRED
jgi:hypothetical protein